MKGKIGKKLRPIYISKGHFYICIIYITVYGCTVIFIYNMIM